MTVKELSKSSELKYIDAFPNTTSGPTSYVSLASNIPAFGAMTNVLQGLDDQMRNGDTIFVKKIAFKAAINYISQPTATTAATLVRCLIVQYLDQATPSSVQVFQNTVFATVYSFVPTNDYKETVKILYDETKIISAAGSNGAYFSGEVLPYQKKITFVDNTIANLSGSIGIWLVSENPGTGYYWKSRIQYTDM